MPAARHPAFAVPAALLLTVGLGACGPAGGPVAGPVDAHCTTDAGVVVQATSTQACFSTGGGMAPEAAAVLFNASGADDDCKYDVSFSATAVRQGEDVRLTVVPLRRTDQGAVTGAGVRAEVYLDDTHPAPNAGTTTTEAPPGTYTIAPVRFDASGRWTVRFHLFESCSDGDPASPHGHVAFYLEVP